MGEHLRSSGRRPVPRRSTDADQYKNIAAWVIQGFLAIMFAGAASAKLAGAPALVSVFDQIGFGQWFRYLTALVEFAGAAALIYPGFAAYGALILAVTMVVAVAVHLFILHTSALGAAVLLVLSLAVLWLRRDQLPFRIGG